LGVDAFVSQIYTPKTTKSSPFAVELIAKSRRICNTDIPIEREGDPTKGFLHQLLAKEFAVYRIVQNGHEHDGI
jgi:hypothetical protein